MGLNLIDSRRMSRVMNQSTIVVQDSDRTDSVLPPPHPIVVVLDRLRSAYNVGNIFRLAEVCRVQKVITCGYTATPPHPKLEKTARGCDRLVASEHFADSREAIDRLRADGFQTIAVETVADAPLIWEVALIFPAAFVFGNEALGLAPETLTMCDVRARLPVYGRKNSLNVANCAAAVVYFALHRLYGESTARRI